MLTSLLKKKCEVLKLYLVLFDYLQYVLRKITAGETSLKDAISKSRRLSQSNGMPVEMLFKGEIRRD